MRKRKQTFVISVERNKRKGLRTLVLPITFNRIGEKISRCYRASLASIPLIFVERRCTRDVLHGSRNRELLSSMLLASVYIRTSKSIQGFVVIRLGKFVDALSLVVGRWSIGATAACTIGLFLPNLSLFRLRLSRYRKQLEILSASLAVLTRNGHFRIFPFSSSRLFKPIETFGR